MRFNGTNIEIKPIGESEILLKIVKKNRNRFNYAHEKRQVSIETCLLKKSVPSIYLIFRLTALNTCQPALSVSRIMKW